jgi:hypothetical protein
MANALYQLLVSPDTIPFEYTEIRNIIHRNASTTDGYSTMYEIMEQIHPALNQDAKLVQPQSINCTDIHDYYKQYDSYLLHNSLMGVEYTTRRKVNIFIEGLDSTYEPAIQRIRQHMMTWRKGETEPPDDLQIPVLAQTVERIMLEVSGAPIIRAITKRTDKSTRNNSSTVHNTPRQHTALKRQYIDVQCTYCKSYGHRKVNCDKMALWLLLQDVSTQVEDKHKTRLVENYIKHNIEKRTRNLARLKGTVRQLYTDGLTDQADALWDKCMTATMEPNSSDDDENASTSSAE